MTTEQPTNQSPPSQPLYRMTIGTEHRQTITGGIIIGVSFLGAISQVVAYNYNNNDNRDFGLGMGLGTFTLGVIFGLGYYFGSRNSYKQFEQMQITEQKLSALEQKVSSE